MRLAKRLQVCWQLAPLIFGISPVEVISVGPIFIKCSRIERFTPFLKPFAISQKPADIFFSALVALTMILKRPLHPMNFFFLAAACFAFQLLFSYLVDHLPLTLSFAIAAAVSVGLVFTYLKAVAGDRFARLAAAAQFAYMVLFSYSFFFDGYSGLTITIGAILTLGVLMKVTASMDWSAVIQLRKKAPVVKVPTATPKPIGG